MRIYKKKVGFCAALIAVLVLGLCFVFYGMPDRYVPSADEIAIYITFDIKEDVGLLIYDYGVDGQEYSGGISNADRSLIKHGSEAVIVWNCKELNCSSETVQLSIRFRIITEYVTPNFENVYPDDITEYMDPICFEARFGESYFVTITGDKINGYNAVLNP